MTPASLAARLPPSIPQLLAGRTSLSRVPSDTALRGEWGDLAAWARPGGAVLLHGGGRGFLVLAGQFQSCLDVVGWAAFEAAVREVLGSARARSARGSRRRWPSWCNGRSPLGSEVCVFGLDPVTGDQAHILVEAVPGGPSPS